MKQFKLATLLFSLGGLLGTGTAILGHHSFAAEYDADQMVTLKGTVTKFVWGNPHSHCLIDEKEQGAALRIGISNLEGPVCSSRPAGRKTRSTLATSSLCGLHWQETIRRQPVRE